jgi:hypothetical protein
LSLFAGQREHEVGGETVWVASNLLIQALDRHIVSRRQIVVDQDLYSPNRADKGFNALDSGRMRFGFHRQNLIVLQVFITIFKAMKGKPSALMFALLILVIGLAILDPGLSMQPAFAADAVTGAPNLTGVVKGTDGREIKNASIFIYTAGPRAGTGYL